MIVFDRYKRELCRGTFVRGREALVSLCQKMRGGQCQNASGSLDSFWVWCGLILEKNNFAYRDSGLFLLFVLHTAGNGRTFFCKQILFHVMMAQSI